MQGRAAQQEAEGRQALAGRRWADARAAFEAALAREETPEALEGLSWAAWWLDDEAAVFDARLRAFRLRRQRGEVEKAAEVATWLATDELDFHGAVAPANGWLRRARRLLEGRPPSAAHGWLAFQEGYLAREAGDLDAALDGGRRAAEAGRAHGVADLEMLGLALEGATLVSHARVREGMACLDEAVGLATAEEAEQPISAAWTFCLLVSACLAVRDLGRAAEWCDRVGEFAERHGSRYMLAFCRAEHGVLRRWRGEWDAAGDLLEAAVEDFARSRPAWAPGPIAALAELRRRQGRRRDAALLAERSGPATGEALRCRAALALDAGRPEEAVELLERELRRLPAGGVLDRVPVLEQLVGARLAAGDAAGAGEATKGVRLAAVRAGTPAMRAAADACEGAVLAATGRHEDARERLEDALDGFLGVGAPFEAARVRSALARTLAALGRPEAAAAEAQAAQEALTTLGAAPAANDAGPLADLSRREREVLDLLAEGLTNREIAERLVLSEHTVHRHVANVLAKLRVPTRAAAAALAARATRP